VNSNFPLLKLTKMLQNFVWSGNVNQSKNMHCSLEWTVQTKGERRFRSKEKGGLDPRLVNSALHFTTLLVFCNCRKAMSSLVTFEKQWVQKMCKDTFLKYGKSINFNVWSSILSGMKLYLSLIYEHSSSSIGNENTFSFQWTCIVALT
jgi:hypothetical protein